jgi:hypothetical protein
LGQAEIVAYFGVFVPPLSRDSLIRAYGVDCLQEHGKVLLLGASVDDWPVPGDGVGDGDGGTSSESGSGRSTSSSGKQPASVFNIQRLMGGGGSGSGSGKTSASSSSSSATDTAAPWRKPSGWFTDRMVVKRFRSIITVLSPSTAKTIIVAHVDPKVALPQSLINFVMRNMAGILLNVFQRQVQYVAAHPRCLHADKVRENRMRRAAGRQGLKLVKSRRRDPRAADYDRWLLADLRTGKPVTGANRFGWPSMTLEDVEAWLDKEARQ